MNHCSISIYGNNNTIIIGENTKLNNTDFWIEDDGGTIEIGDGTVVSGGISLGCCEGKKITIGSNCLFSTNIRFQNCDSHSIINRNGDRINPSEDIFVGDHVWVGRDVMILKGSNIPGHSVVGAGTIFTHKFDEPHCVFAGVPAKVVKREIDWRAKRI